MSDEELYKGALVLPHKKIPITVPQWYWQILAFATKEYKQDVAGELKTLLENNPGESIDKLVLDYVDYLNERYQVE